MPQAFFIWDIIGVFVFAVSGALAARQKHMDPWGMFILAIITGTGGGTLRSILIGDLPPAFLRHPGYLASATAGVLLTLLVPHAVRRLEKPILVIDAMGLGVYVCLGTIVSLHKGLAPWAALAMGVVTAVFGGVLRDVFRAEVPLIFKREIYATAALLGGILFLALRHIGVPQTPAIVATTAVTLAIRLLAIRYRINMRDRAGSG